MLQCPDTQLICIAILIKYDQNIKILNDISKQEAIIIIITKKKYVDTNYMYILNYYISTREIKDKVKELKIKHK